MIVRRAVLAAAFAAAALGDVPAGASLPMRFWVEYAGSGTDAFACHNVAASGGTNPRLGSATYVSCSLNGFPSAQVIGGGAAATSAGLANATLGDTVQICVAASTVYGFPHLVFYSVNVCRDVTLAPAGTVYL